jgi:replicative DNA helicase
MEDNEKRISFKKKEVEELPDDVSITINQKKVIDDALEYIRKRKDGEIEYLKTGYYSIDRKLLNGGFEPNSILVLSGLSGSGKSTLSKHLIYSINNYYNKRRKKVKTLCFNFEMLALKTAGREIAKTTRLSLSELYSSNEKLEEDVYEEISKITRAKLTNYDIRYVERPTTVDNIIATIKYY